MAPKQADKIENPPVAASSSEEEEEEESTSSGEASDSSGEEPDDVLSKLTQKPLAPPPTKKPESDSESDSDSDSEPVTKTKPLNTLPKRTLKQPDDEPKKKLKTSTDEDVKKISGEEAKKLFQRLFSESDEIALLQGFLDFTSTRGDPYENMDVFCDYIKTLIDFNASKAQIVTKLQRCKKKFVNTVKNSLKKGKTEDKVTQKAFELSRKIWGSDGVLPAKPSKKAKEVKGKREVVEVERRKVNVVETSREMGLFFKAENVSVLGLDENAVSKVWDMVEDGRKKKEVEEKVRKLKAMQMELCLQRTALLDNTAKMIFKDDASSSS